MHRIELTHQTDTGHRIPGHQGGAGKCARLHGHTYSFSVALKSDRLDASGFVVDFGIIKAILDEWDHRTLLWEGDVLWALENRDAAPTFAELGVIAVPFIPTAENMAQALAERFALLDHVTHSFVAVRETAKSVASYSCNRFDIEKAVAA